MASEKISQLPAITNSAIGANSLFPVVNSTDITTYSIELSQLDLRWRTATITPTTFQILNSGSSNYILPTNPSPIQLYVKMVGGGGGTSGAGASGTTAGTDGTPSSFNSLTVNGGMNSGAGGGGGSGTAVIRISGNSGSMAAQNGAFGLGGAGGGSMLGFSTFPPIAVTSGTAVSGISPTGGYGGGAAGPTGDLLTFGGVIGAGGGEYAEFLIDSPSGTIPYSVGSGGAGGNGTANGAVGAAGVIIIFELYE